LLDSTQVESRQQLEVKYQQLIKTKGSKG